MAEHRRIPEVERLEGRDMPSVLGVPYVAPSPLHAPAAPQVAVLAPNTPSVAGESPVTRDVVAPIAAGAGSDPFAAVWQQSADALFSLVGGHGDAIATAWTQPPAPHADAAIHGVTAPAHETGPTETVTLSSSQPAPTITGVLRYAWRSVNRHRVDDRDDAVQQICLEWLLMAATVATSYDDVRRIVARVLNRAYRRMKRQGRAVELLDVPVNADPVEDAFRDMQLDRDLGMNDLTDREWQVIRLRQQGCTFAEIGLQLGMRRQRARDLFVAALSSLRERYRKSFLVD